MLAKIHVSVKTERNIGHYFAKTESKKSYISDKTERYYTKPFYEVSFLNLIPFIDMLPIGSSRISIYTSVYAFLAIRPFQYKDALSGQDDSSLSNRLCNS